MRETREAPDEKGALPIEARLLDGRETLPHSRAPVSASTPLVASPATTPAENAGEDRRAGAPAPAPRAVPSQRLARLANPPPSYAWYLDAAISTVSPASRRRDATRR